ncbi:hypothetical protein MUN46_009020 [Mesosutterella sp. AGMB02718]|uniref:ATP-binding protein n=1 Tax=Mesosutterella faecium TaxID=2925194 RepID=A0ABT7INV9_9BURK|nr:hypothetical protein [Mesosutterella sp. AGMB02718]MDL2060073.1 hypothetical protein [Mesosutterella sp. AGMB02718]
MCDSWVRLTSVLIEHFRSVAHGELSLVNRRRVHSASVLGLCGQNGSGKTALIAALRVLQQILSRHSVDENLTEYIQAGERCARLSFDFCVRFDSGEVPVSYEFKIFRRLRLSTDAPDDEAEQGETVNPVIQDEKLYAALPEKNGGLRRTLLIDTSGNPFIPVSKYRQLIGRSPEARANLTVAKKLAEERRLSFIWSPALLEQIKQRMGSSPEALPLSEQVCKILQRLNLYGTAQLFVFGPAAGMPKHLDVLPLRMKYESSQEHTAPFGSVPLTLNGPALLPEPMFLSVQRNVHQISLVLEKLIPGLEIQLKDLGNELSSAGQMLKRVELVSVKNRTPIPLRYESEGIRKIIAVLPLLIGVYNRKSVTAAVDNLDSGIFEYLLGELLRIISEQGRGQLIFTSHNFRPLETLDKGSVAFTTANPLNCQY